MKRRPFMGMGIVALIAGASAAADTVYLSDGSALNGKVSRPNPNVVEVEMIGHTLTLQSSEVERIEPNDKMGEYVNPAAQRHEQSLRERTRLISEQRAEIDALLEPLKSESADERTAAKAALLRKGRELDLFPYFETSITGLTGLYVPHVLDILMELDAKKALPVVRRCSEHREPIIRAKSLELLAAGKDEEDVERLARGVLDPVAGVRTSAMLALRTRGERRATPLLIECLKDPDMRVRNAAAVALGGLWQDSAPPAEATSEAWQAFWAAHSTSVKNPWDAEALVPLSGEDPRQAVYHNE